MQNHVSLNFLAFFFFSWKCLFNFWNDCWQQEASTEEKRKQHQRELASQVNEEAKQRLAQQKVPNSISCNFFKNIESLCSTFYWSWVIITQGRSGGEKVRKSTVSYKSARDLPKEDEVKELKVYVGKLREKKSVYFLFHVNWHVYIYQIESTKLLFFLFTEYLCRFTYRRSRIAVRVSKAITPTCESTFSTRVPPWAELNRRHFPIQKPHSSKKCKLWLNSSFFDSNNAIFMIFMIIVS